MAFGFGRKKGASGGDEAQGAQSASQAPPKAKKRKPNEMLSSVIKESTEGAAVALMRSNELFLVDGGSKAVILLLDVAKPSFGGLSQKQRGDETKGSIIELIQADHIKTVATAGMLEEDIFGIIPTLQTVERMDEFDLLVNAEYNWATVDLATFSIAEGGPATFAQAKQVANDLASIESVMGAGVAAPAAAAAPAPAPATEVLAAVPDDEVDYGDEDDQIEDDYVPAASEPAGDDEPDFGEEPDFGDEEPVDYGDLDAEDGGDFDDDGYAGDDEGGFEDYADEGYEAETSDREVTEEEVENTIARRYLSGDLDLEVDLAPFENYLGTNEPIALFSEEADVDDWLGNQIAQMAKQANAEIVSSHQRGIAELRQQYLGLMSLHVEDVVKQLDLDDPTTSYGDLRKRAISDHRDRAVRAEEIAANRRREIKERFDSEVEVRALAAAEQERIRYRDRHGAKLERDLSEVNSQVAAQSDDMLAQAQEHILSSRRNDASKRMDLGVNRILDALGERHRSFIDEEARLYEVHSQRMQAFLDDYRKEDLARSHALQEELSRNDQVQRAGQEYAARMDAAAAEHRAEIARLHDEIEKLHEAAKSEMVSAEKRWNGLLEVERANTQAANVRADEINQRLTLVDQRTNEQYKDRLAAMDEERRRAVDEADRAAKVSDRGSKMLALLGLVMAVAALAIGILIGMMWVNSRGAGGGMMLPHFAMLADTFLHSTAADPGSWLTAIPSSTQTSA